MPSLSHYRPGIELLSMTYQSIIGPSGAAASYPQPNAPTWNDPQYDGPVPIVRSRGTSQERWDSLNEQLFNKTGIEEGKNYVGQSILTEWLDQFPGQRSWTCQIPVKGSGGRPCGAGFSRVERATVHIRGKHLDMRPYHCGNGGNCQVPNWLAPFFLSGCMGQTRIYWMYLLFSSAMAFTSRENRAEHWNPKKIPCAKWYDSLPWISYLWTQ